MKYRRVLTGGWVFFVFSNFWICIDFGVSYCFAPFIVVYTFIILCHVVSLCLPPLPLMVSAAYYLSEPFFSKFFTLGCYLIPFLCNYNCLHLIYMIHRHKVITFSHLSPLCFATFSALRFDFCVYTLPIKRVLFLL